MEYIIYKDAILRPDLFFWFGAINRNHLSDWLEDEGLINKIPNDLLDLWEQTGGGDFLETETILGPFGDPNLGDDIKSVNRFNIEKGMPKEYLIFHTGIITSAIVLIKKEYIEIEPTSYKILRRFSDLNEWYCEGIQKELGNRYGL